MRDKKGTHATTPAVWVGAPIVVAVIAAVVGTWHVAQEVERVRTQLRTDATGDASNNQAWFVAALALIVVCCAVVIAMEAAHRRSQDISTLQHDATTDPLTGLPNRRAFDARVRAALNDRTLAGHAYFHLDIDYFKDINDSLGHAAGDTVLRELTNRCSMVTNAWQRQLPGGRTHIHAARLGGDEFVVAAHGIDVSGVDISALADLLQSSLSGPVATQNGIASMTVSVGAAHTTGTCPFSDLEARADSALYDAKQRGRATAVVAFENSWPAPSSAAAQAPAPASTV